MIDYSTHYPALKMRSTRSKCFGGERRSTLMSSLKTRLNLMTRRRGGKKFLKIIETGESFSSALSTRTSRKLEDGAQGRSLPHIYVLRDTGASLHIGIEPPTRGFSIRNVNLLGFINQ